jgi:hypothetical protein
MTEGLFVLTIIFVAYIVYVTINDNKKSSKSETQKAKDVTPIVTLKQSTPEPIKAKTIATAITAAQPAKKPTKPPVTKQTVVEPIKAKAPTTVATKTVGKPVVAKATTPSVEKPKQTTIATKAAATQITEKKGLRNPLTGEVTTSYSNYRFTKRWIKDALVVEGLVSKVYSNTELNAAIETTIKSALVKLEAIDKYKP